MQAQFNLQREQTDRLFAVDGKNFGCEFHFHSHVELVVVLEGQAEVTINDRQRLLDAGEMAVALSYDAHGFHSVTPSHMISIVIPTELCPDFVAAVSNKKTRNPFIRSAALFETVCNAYRGIKSGTNAISRQGHLYVMLGALLEHMELEQCQDASDPRLFTDILLYISKHYAENITLSSIAGVMGYHPSYLSRAFKGRFHISLVGYITMLRLRQAVLLMGDPQKSIADCAFESGFRSLRTFYRAFSDEFRCSPKEYRRKQFSIHTP